LINEAELTGCLLLQSGIEGTFGSKSSSAKELQAIFNKKCELTN